MEDPDTQDIDNTSQDDLQDENIVQNLLCETACLRHAVEKRQWPQGSYRTIRTKT